MYYGLLTINTKAIIAPKSRFKPEFRKSTYFCGAKTKAKLKTYPKQEPIISNL
jgi:hypothetical protein